MERAFVEKGVAAKEAADLGGDDLQRLLLADHDLRQGNVAGRHVLHPELDEVAVVDAKDDTGPLERHRGAGDVEVDEPEIVGDLAGAAGGKDEVLLVEPEQRRLRGDEAARDPFQRRETHGVLRVRRELIPGARDPRDAGALGRFEAAATRVDIARPLAVLLAEVGPCRVDRGQQARAGALDLFERGPQAQALVLSRQLGERAARIARRLL